jgi:hypothetical protein
VILLLALIAPLYLAGQDALPAPVREGLDELGAGECDKAMTLWTSTWSDAQKAQMSPTCPTLKQLGGGAHGYDVLKIVEISPHLRRVYAMLLFDAQPIYVMVSAYSPTGKAWTVGAVNWHTDPDQVIPSQIMPPQRPKP